MISVINGIHAIFHNPHSIKIIHLCLIWCRIVRFRDVHPCYMVPRCPVSRCQPSQFRWSRDVQFRVFSRPPDPPTSQTEVRRLCRFCAPARHFFPPQLYGLPIISPCSHGSRWMALSRISITAARRNGNRPLSLLTVGIPRVPELPK